MKDKKILKYKIYVKLNKKEDKLIPIDSSSFVAELKERPINNRANLDLLELLSLHFNINKNNIDIKGLRSRIKYISLKYE